MEDTWHFPAFWLCPSPGCGSHCVPVAHHVRRQWCRKWNMLRVREGSPEHWNQFLKSQGWCALLVLPRKGCTSPGQWPATRKALPPHDWGSQAGWIVDGCILQSAASCTSEGRYGTDQFWQQRTPVLGVDMVLRSGTASVKSGDNLFWNPVF